MPQCEDMTEQVPLQKSAVCFWKHCSSAVICMRVECKLCCLSCIILNIVCRMDVIDSATALHIKRAQHRHIGIIHSGNSGLQDHQMNIKPLIKAKLWHDTPPLSWAASDNRRMLDFDEKCWRGYNIYCLCLFPSYSQGNFYFPRGVVWNNWKLSFWKINNNEISNKGGQIEDVQKLCFPANKKVPFWLIRYKRFEVSLCISLPYLSLLISMICSKDFQVLTASYCQLLF